MAKTLLVAGASGALGREVVRLALAGGWQVRAMTRDASRTAGLGVTTVVADARDARSLPPAVEGADAVFSSLGASPIPDPRLGWRGFRGVDWPLNKNLVEAAGAAGVKKLVYVSAYHSPDMRRLAYIDAHERVADLLGAGKMEHAVVRPTGFYSAIGSFVDMAKKGALPTFGNPAALSNPIHDVDLAEICVEALAGDARDVPAGGPEVLSRGRIVQLVFEALGREPRVRRIPLWFMRAASFFMKPVLPRIADCLGFFAHVMSHDLVAPARGTRKIGDYFKERARLSG